MRPTGLKYLVLASALVLTSVPTMVQAEIDFGELAISEDIAPQERLTKKIELTRDALSMAIEKAEAMKTSLETLELETASPEEELKNLYLSEVAGYLTFYREREAALDAVTSPEEVDAFIQTVIKYREGVYAPSAKNVLEFILVFSYNPSVLKTAKERYVSIAADAARLSGLGLIEEVLCKAALEQCQTTLDEAAQLQSQAREALLAAHQSAVALEEATETPLEGSAESETTVEAMAAPVVLTPKELSEMSLNKIKEAYTVFIETGQKIKEALGI